MVKVQLRAACGKHTGNNQGLMVKVLLRAACGKHTGNNQGLMVKVQLRAACGKHTGNHQAVRPAHPGGLCCQANSAVVLPQKW